MAHSPPDGRQAVPCKEAVVPDWPVTVARKARQISSVLTNGWPTGAKFPFIRLSGLSHVTDEPLPCGSSAMVRAPRARRQSSSPRSADRGDTTFGLSEFVVSVSGSKEV